MTNKLRNRTTMMWKTAKFAQRWFKNELGKVSMLSLQVCSLHVSHTALNVSEEITCN